MPDRFDKCQLTAIDNKRFQDGSFRYRIYKCIEKSRGITIEQIVTDGHPLLKVRRSVKCLCADGKINIEGWEVVTPKTLNFRPKSSTDRETITRELTEKAIRSEFRLETDGALREALYGLYIALFKAKQTCPEDFSDGHLTKILTAVMGIENFGWRVIGITWQALDLLATKDFYKAKLHNRLCRGHINDRIKTTRELFNRKKPMELVEFYEFFVRNDQTVIMLKEENKHAGQFPDYIKIDNPNCELFPNGSLIAWKHRKKEREYLMKLHSSL
jgi:hypothetical protein